MLLSFLLESLVSVDRVKAAGDQHPVKSQTCKLFDKTVSQVGDVFSRVEQDFGRTSTVRHRIHLVDVKPVSRTLCRSPLHVRYRSPTRPSKLICDVSLPLFGQDQGDLGLKRGPCKALVSRVSSSVAASTPFDDKFVSCIS